MSKTKPNPVSNNDQPKILKFRSFASKQEEGFVLVFDHQIPQMIFEDLLFQLFEPLFQQLFCPQIYYFSSTDQSLSYAQMIKMKDYIYVHFLQRVQQYERSEKYTRKLKIGNIDQLAQGINFNGINLYIISEKYYLMYGHQFFYKNIEKKIQNIPLHIQRKQIKYDQYCNQLINLKDNHKLIKIKEELSQVVQRTDKKMKMLQNINNRYIMANTALRNILKQSGIKILGLKDLY